MGRFFVTTLLAVAEMERSTIIERTQARKAIAKQREGFKDGRPNKYSYKKLKQALSMLAVNGGAHSYNELKYTILVSKNTLMGEDTSFRLIS